MENNIEIQEGNKLIAEFMGATIHDKWGSYLDATYYTPMKHDTSPFTGKHDAKVTALLRDAEAKHLWNPKYHSSWDWLMPVFIKFRTCIDITGNPTEKYYQQYSQHCQQIATAIAHLTIEESFQRLVKAILWYNQNKNP